MPPEYLWGPAAYDLKKKKKIISNNGNGNTIYSCQFSIADSHVPVDVDDMRNPPATPIV